jgi:hypothetical protein
MTPLCAHAVLHTLCHIEVHICSDCGSAIVQDPKSVSHAGGTKIVASPLETPLQRAQALLHQVVASEGLLVASERYRELGETVVSNQLDALLTRIQKELEL